MKGQGPPEADFTEDAYARLLERLRARWSPAPFRCALDEGVDCLWRHDIDYSPMRAARLAQLEADHGVVATYFVHLHAIFYNALDPDSLSALRRIRDLGHEIGLHADLPALGERTWSEESMERFLRREAELLADALQTEVSSLSFHNPTAAGELPQQDRIAGLINAYGPSLQARYRYCSDSNGHWRADRLADVLEDDYQPIHVLTHPGWWTREAEAPRNRILGMIEGRAQSTRETYVETLAATGRTDQPRGPRERFGCVREIELDDPSSWQGRTFLTFDLDWVADEVLAEVLDLVEGLGVAATWFVTHDTPLLERMRANPRFELGIHPNFNGLLGVGQGPTPAGGAREVLDDLLRVVPEAVSTRSHSMTQGSHLLEACLERGLTHDCNHFVPYESRIPLRPWRHWNGQVKVPYCWEDDVRAIVEDGLDPAPLLAAEGLKVVDFHPIHVFLNMATLELYESTRSLHREAARLRERRHPGRGTQTFLTELVERSRGEAPCASS